MNFVMGIVAVITAQVSLHCTYSPIFAVLLTGFRIKRRRRLLPCTNGWKVQRPLQPPSAKLTTRHLRFDIVHYSCYLFIM